jgi:hypothetical protein
VKLEAGDLVRHGSGQFADDWGVGLVMGVGQGYAEVYWFKEKRQRMHPTLKYLKKAKAQSED